MEVHRPCAWCRRAGREHRHTVTALSSCSIQLSSRSLHSRSPATMQPGPSPIMRLMALISMCSATLRLLSAMHSSPRTTGSGALGVRNAMRTVKRRSAQPGAATCPVQPGQCSKTQAPSTWGLACTMPMTIQAT